MKLKVQDDSPYFLIAVNESFETNMYTLAYCEFAKSEILRWFELKDTIKELGKDIEHIATRDSPIWIEGIPDELEELNEITNEICQVFISKLPVGYAEKNECRNENAETHISDYGVSFRTRLSYQSISLTTFSVPWDFLEQALKNYEPHSVKFIKDEESSSHKGCERAIKKNNNLK